MNNLTKIKILSTLGPSSLDKVTLQQLDAEGVDLFRINLSHTHLSELESVIRFIQENTHIPICIDSEGAQLRTGALKGGEIILQEGDTIKMGQRTSKEKTTLHFNYDIALSEIELGEIIYIDFDTVAVQVIEKNNSQWIGHVLSGGKVGSNKAVHTSSKHIFLPPLTKKDKQAISIGKENGIRYFALSFANCVEDVKLMRSHIGEDSFLISKIETNGGLRYLEGICKHSDALLVDRGDLSRSQPLEKIPFLQKEIIAGAKQLKKEVYVATNLLETMVHKKEPTRAEVSDVAATLLEGASGLVLAAETAIGKYPVLCVQMINKIIQECQQYHSKQPLL